MSRSPCLSWPLGGSMQQQQRQERIAVSVLHAVGAAAHAGQQGPAYVLCVAVFVLVTDAPLPLPLLPPCLPLLQPRSKRLGESCASTSCNNSLATGRASSQAGVD